MEFGQSAQVPALITRSDTTAVKQGGIFPGSTAARRKVKKILLKHPRKGDNQIAFSTRESDQDNTNSEKTTITEKTTVSYRTEVDDGFLDRFLGIFWRVGWIFLLFLDILHLVEAVMLIRL